MARLDLLATGLWSAWRPATCLPNDCFCEAIGDGVIRQPANTWSSLAFVLVAVWILVRRGRNDAARRALRRSELGLFLGSLVAVGLGSAIYHASLTFIGQVFDVSGMYFIATFILLHRLGPSWKLPAGRSIAGFVGVNGVLMLAQVTTPSLRRGAFGVLLVSALAVEWRSSRGGRRFLGSGALLMAIAFAIWGLDRIRVICAPASLLQGHAVWHLLGALSAACLFRSYEADVDSGFV